MIQFIVIIVVSVIVVLLSELYFTVLVPVFNFFNLFTFYIHCRMCSTVSCITLYIHCRMCIFSVRLSLCCFATII